jgi:hypothetical protein
VLLATRPVDFCQSLEDCQHRSQRTKPNVEKRDPALRGTPDQRHRELVATPRASIKTRICSVSRGSGETLDADAIFGRRRSRADAGIFDVDDEARLAGVEQLLAEVRFRHAQPKFAHTELMKVVGVQLNADWRKGIQAIEPKRQRRIDPTHDDYRLDVIECDLQERDRGNNTICSKLLGWTAPRHRVPELGL